MEYDTAANGSAIRDKGGVANEAKDGERRKMAGVPRHVSAIELFGDAREVILEHDGQLYRLRITANGKLILTK